MLREVPIIARVGEPARAPPAEFGRPFGRWWRDRPVAWATAESEEHAHAEAFPEAADPRGAGRGDAGFGAVAVSLFEANRSTAGLLP